MDDLIGLQQSSKPIRNPFGFDFVHTWNSRPMVLRANPDFIHLIGPLRDHMAKHLFMKVKYRWADEQKAVMKKNGQADQARTYMVPRDVEDKIWMMITGEARYDGKASTPANLDTVDLSELNQELAKLGSSSANTSMPDMTSLLATATLEALAADKNNQAVSKGSASLAAAQAPANSVQEQPKVVDLTNNPILPQAPLPTPSTVVDLGAVADGDFGQSAPEAPIAPETTQISNPSTNEGEGFAGMENLDNNGFPPPQNGEVL